MTATDYPFSRDASILQDGARLSAALLEDRAASLAVALAGHGRVVVCTTQAATLVIALLACRMAECELLMLRGASGEDPGRLAHLGAEALVSDELDVVPTGVAASGRRAFVLLLGTSGTTGIPKIARHSLERLMGRIKVPRAGSDTGVWLLTYHPASFAGIQVILSSLIGGGLLVTSSNLGMASLAAAAMELKPTHISGTPTFWRALLLALGSQAAALPLRKITLGGEPVDQSILDRLAGIFPAADITHIYASTEAGALFAVHDKRAGFPSELLHRDVDGVRLRIREGVLEVMSPRTTLGYDGTQVNVPYSEDGWLITNDLVTERADRVVFLGRHDALINVGGNKVTPDEVEEALLGVPGVGDAKVYAMRSSIAGSIVAADVCLLPGHTEPTVRRWINERLRILLEPHKRPRIVKFVEGLEISETGKKSRKE